MIGYKLQSALAQLSSLSEHFYLMFQTDFASVKMLAVSKWQCAAWVLMSRGLQCCSWARDSNVNKKQTVFCPALFSWMKLLHLFPMDPGSMGMQESDNRQCKLTVAAAMPAVCAAMAVAFLAFWKPSVPQDVWANGLLSKLTTWMWVLQQERDKRKKEARRGFYCHNAWLHHRTWLPSQSHMISFKAHQFYSHGPPSSELRGYGGESKMAEPLWTACSYWLSQRYSQPFRTHFSQ